MTKDRRQNAEDRRKTCDARRRAMTLIEIIVSLAIITIILAVIVPQFVMMRSSWASKEATTEVLQNGRILLDHLERNLLKAVRITAVSSPSTTTGYIQFVANDGNSYKYDIASSYIRYGIVGVPSTLAGPATQLQFSCYDACNLDTPLDPITDANIIRSVKAEFTVYSPTTTSLSKTFDVNTYLRTNSSLIWELNKGTNVDFYTVGSYIDAALAQIDDTHYLCVYAGTGSDGYTVVLTVDANMVITAGTPCQYTTPDYSDARYPAVAQIDSTNYLCVYRGKVGSYNFQYAVVLTVDTGWTVTARALTQLDSTCSDTGCSCKYNRMVKLNDSDYLCVYSRDTSGPGYAEALRVEANDTNGWTITSGDPCVYDSVKGNMPDLARIDNTHGLCVYYDNQNPYKGDWAVVLTVDPQTLVVTKGEPCDYDTSGGNAPAITQIDDTHYLTAYSQSTGYAAVLTVNTGDWTISKGTGSQFETASISTPALAKIDSTHYLCAYNGKAVILTVNTADWTVSKEQASLVWESSVTEPALVKVNENVNDALFLCAYLGSSSYGWSVMLEATKIRP